MNRSKEFAEESEEQLNLRTVIVKYLSHWKWLFFSVLLSLAIAVVYLRYTQPIFVSQATLLIKDDQKGGSVPGMAIFDDLGLSSGSSNLENEIQILKSRKLAELVIKKLGLNKTYIVRGERSGLKVGELYLNSPIKIEHVEHDSLLYDHHIGFELKIKDENSFFLSTKSGESIGLTNFGEKIETPAGSVIIKKTAAFTNKSIGIEYIVSVASLNHAITTLQNSLAVKKVNIDTQILLISLIGPNISKNNMIIDELIFQHEFEEIRDKHEVTESTRDFIKERMKFISRELSEVDSASSLFKTRNDLVDVSLNSKLLLEKEGKIEKEIIETNIQLELINFLNQSIEKNDDVENLLPSNLGVDDKSVAEMVLNYNRLVLERNSLLQGSSYKNPNIIRIKGKLISIKSSLQGSLKNLVATANMKLNALNSKAKMYDSKLSSVPSYEKEYRDIFRQQQIKETLYLYLLEKREENEIAMVAMVANAKVIDAAYSNGIPVSPKKKIIFIGAFLIGLIVPIAFIFIIDLLDNKVHSTVDLNVHNLPHVAVIPFSKERIKLVALDNPRSVLSEAFRILRTNVSFLFTEQKEKGNTILVTSTIAGEGKTSVSLNIAHSLALTGKKTVIIGLDLRAPKLLEYLELNKSARGVSDFIVNPDLSADDITMTLEGADNLYMIPSGTTPPNPSELLLKPRVDELFEQVKKDYDYIIVDTAPVGLVTDTLVAAHTADVSLYVVRANVLEKEMLKVPARMYREKKLTNMSIVLNGVGGKKGTNTYEFEYGYGYGDDFEEDRKKWWQRRKS